MLDRISCGALLMGALSMTASHIAGAACKMAKMAEIPVTMAGLSPLIDAKINGTDVRFIVDSGAFYSMLTGASAAQLNLKLKAAPYGMGIVGLTGRTAPPSVTNVETFTLAGIPVHNIGFFVTGSLGSLGGGSVGLLGQNVFGVSDVEYDFANGKVRFIKSDDCQRAMLAYWVAAGQPYSVLDIDPISNYHTHITSYVYLNGTKIAVTFDTGAPVSILSLRTAERAGINPTSNGVVDAGFVGGTGYGYMKTYTGVFSSLKIGDEQVQNARLRFGGIFSMGTEMLLGADFFLSHRVYLAPAQKKLYFTYNGGPVFNLKKMAADGSSEETAESKPATSADEQTSTVAQADPGLAATDYVGRGAAAAARGDFVRAIEDLTHACELSPDNPEFLFQRARVYLQSGNRDAAARDLDHALTLQPEHLAALVSRAEIRIKAKDFAGARTDLDAADRVAAKQAEIRFELGQDYMEADLPGLAVGQFNTWILTHPQDSKLLYVRARRCWASALQNTDLDQAMADCDAAIGRTYQGAAIFSELLTYRGLVYYRMGRYDKAISDYSDAFKRNSKAALALYVRGLAEIRANRRSEGEADIAQALKLKSGVADQLDRIGIKP